MTHFHLEAVELLLKHFEAGVRAVTLAEIQELLLYAAENMPADDPTYVDRMVDAHRRLKVALILRRERSERSKQPDGELVSAYKSMITAPPPQEPPSWWRLLRWWR